MARGGKKLTREERVLWGKVARSTNPLPGRMDALLSTSAETPTAALMDSKVTDSPSKGLSAPMRQALAAAFANGETGSGEADNRHRNRQPPLTRKLNPIEKPVHKKIARGRLALEARVDLHGMSQAEAHGVLHDFLSRAYRRGLRHVLVITGKGASMGSQGALKRVVPQWLAKPEFAEMVSGHEQAARGHGGEGAMYIRLKKLLDQGGTL